MKDSEKDINQSEDTTEHNSAEEAVVDPENQQEQSEEVQDTEASEELEKLNIQLQESKDKYLRLYSEFENFRRRTAKEKLDLISTANEDLMTAMLPVMDDFERANKSIDKEGSDLKSLKEGMDLVFQKFQKTLEQKGLKSMDAGEGSDFDPDFHEAITQIPAPSKKLKGKVVDVIEKGYLLKDKVIRYAKVVIGS
jgi:molecular chaperone GrpE